MFDVQFTQISVPWEMSKNKKTTLVPLYKQFLLLILLHTVLSSELDLDKALLSIEHVYLERGSTLPIAVGFVAIPLGSWRRGAFPPRNFSWATSL